MGISDFLCSGYGEQWVRLVFFIFGDRWGALARPPLLNPWWHGRYGGRGELGERVLKAEGIEIWSSSNEKGFFSFAAEKAGVKGWSWMPRN